MPTTFALSSALALQAALLLVSPTAHAAFLMNIDDFEDGMQSLDFTGTSGITTEPVVGAGGAIVGLERSTTFSVVSNPLPTAASFEAANPSIMAIDFGPFVEGSVELVYDGVGSAGLGGIDLTAGGANTFGFDVLSSEQDLTIQISLWDLAGVAASHSGVVPGGVTSSQVFEYGYADFAVGPGFDWTAVDSIELDFEPLIGGDFVVDGIGTLAVPPTVPEPSAAILLMVSGVSLLMRRKRC